MGNPQDDEIFFLFQSLAPALVSGRQDGEEYQQRTIDVNCSSPKIRWKIRARSEQDPVKIRLKTLKR